MKQISKKLKKKVVYHHIMGKKGQHGSMTEQRNYHRKKGDVQSKFYVKLYFQSTYLLPTVHVVAYLVIQQDFNKVVRHYLASVFCKTIYLAQQMVIIATHNSSKEPMNDFPEQKTMMKSSVYSIIIMKEKKLLRVVAWHQYKITPPHAPKTNREKIL